MKSAEAYVEALAYGLTPDAAFSSLRPWQPAYCERIPIHIYNASQQLGWRFFPILRRRGASDANLLLHRATSDLEQLRRWARQRPNWALATGLASGVLVVRVDGPEGLTSLLELCEDDWDWLDTLRSLADQTRHIFFSWPGSQYKIDGPRNIGKNLSVLEEGDWLLMPPSIESSGAQHVYLNPRLWVSSLPPWLFDRIFGRESDVAPVPPFGLTSSSKSSLYTAASRGLVRK